MNDRDDPSLDLVDRGTADFHDDGDTVRRSVTIRRPMDEVRQAFESAGIRGDVTFASAPGDRGIEVRVTAPRDAQSTFKEIIGAYKSDEPGGSLSTALRQLKAKLETGEIATTHGQPSGREAKKA
jgi:hypothetical protein